MIDQVANEEIHLAWKILKVLAPLSFAAFIATVSWIYVDLIKPAAGRLWEVMNNMQEALQGIREELRDLKHADQRLAWRVDQIEERHKIEDLIAKG